MASHHVNTDRLLDFASGTVPRGEADAIAGHCVACERCGDHLAVFLLLRRQSRRMKAQRTRLLSAAAILLLVIGIAAVVAGIREMSTSPSQPAWSELATNEGIDPRLARFLFGVGAPASLGTYDAREREAFQLLVEMQLGAAIPALRELAEVRPGDPNASAFLGIALYLSGETGLEVETLLNVGQRSSTPAIQHYAQWYLGNHLLRNGMLADARAVLEDLSQYPDRPGRQAQELLVRLNNTRE